MANLFDAANAPEGEPIEFIVGDFLQWKRSDIAQDYPPSAHSAEYVARIKSTSSGEIKIAATEPSGDDYYLFSVASAVSADFVAGDYSWQLEITETSSGNRITVDEGDFTIVGDLDNDADPRIHAEIMVDKIESILEGKADSDVSNYSIAGRSITKMTFDELLAARDRYRAEVTKHNNKELVKRGKQNGSTIKVRFA
jgi:hypothetical protein